MTDVLRHNFGNPSSIHADGRIARATVEAARKQIAQTIRASIGEIFFTSGGTEGSNMILKNAVRDLGVRHIISSSLEHHCVAHSLQSIEKNSDCQIKFTKCDDKGNIDVQDLENLLKNAADTGGGAILVSLMHANNEIGTMLDLEKISQLCKKYNAFFHSDTVQTVGHFDIDVSKTLIHFLTGTAHKFHGPKGVGFAYVNSDAMLSPFIDGGSQERNMRGGTENVASIVGMAKALELACEHMETRKKHILSIRNALKNQILTHFEGIELNGEQDDEFLYTVLSVSFPPSFKSELLLFNLDIAGISASGGSACSSGVEGGSDVLTAIGADPERKTIRFSFSHLNTLEEVDFVIEKLKKII
jgi:cysteine desulfurase